jgi:hypothetical protein
MAAAFPQERRNAMADDRKRDPHSDAELIEQDVPTPSQSGTSGGGMQREIGALDDEKTATGADPQPTSVHKGMKPRSGDEPSLPNRQRTSDDEAKARPRRS